MRELNICFKNDAFELNKDLINIIFGEEEVMFVDENFDIFDALVLIGVFKSKTQARKNWKRGMIKGGYQEFLRLGKFNKNLYIWKCI